MSVVTAINCTVLRVVSNFTAVIDTGYMCVRRYLVARFETVDQLLKTMAIYNTQRVHILSYKLNNLLCDDSSMLGESWGTLPNQGRPMKFAF